MGQNATRTSARRNRPHDRRPSSRRFLLDFLSECLSRSRAAHWLAEQIGGLACYGWVPKVCRMLVFNTAQGRQAHKGVHMRQFRAMLWLAMVAQVLLASAPRAQVPDHLKCYKIKETAQKATYTADLGGLAPEP